MQIMKDRPKYYLINYQEKTKSTTDTPCEIVTILEKYSTDSTLIIFQLPLPPMMF